MEGNKATENLENISSDPKESKFQSADIVRRLRVDRWAKYLVSFGGISIIFAISAILFVILAVAYPLFKSPELTLTSVVQPREKSGNVFFVGVDEYREIAYEIHPKGFSFYSLVENKPLLEIKVSGLNDSLIESVVKFGKSNFALGLSDGRVILTRLNFDVSFKDGIRSIAHRLKTELPFQALPDNSPIKRMAFFKGEKGYWIAIPSEASKVLWIAVRESRTMMGKVKKKKYSKQIVVPEKGGITALVSGVEGETLLVGSGSGQLIRVFLGNPKSDEVEVDTLGATAREGIGVSNLAFLLGGQTLIVGDQDGGVNSYQIIREKGGARRLMPMHAFEPHEKEISVIQVSLRNKGFITGDSTGKVKYHYGTSGSTHFDVPLKNRKGVLAALIAPKNDGLILAGSDGSLFNWKMNHPHPEVGWRTLFGEVVYEGYKEADFVWQSTGGSDEFEPKFSLMPLIHGALKGTFYAILFAVPIALFGAFYTSEFMNPKYKALIKPIIEIMAALPSVVLGFFAALWLAPNIEKLLPGLIISPFIVMALIFVYLVAKEKYPEILTFGRKAGSELWPVTILVIIGSLMGLGLSGQIEGFAFAGDYRLWLNNSLGLDYDQRNSLVVGLAMGFAVTPIIYTIAEDSLSNIPSHLKAGSLALGATPWQTGIKVVLPTASPGIFSAIMIGFGRAVGETMIVLMATGNTPIMDWNIFSGFRAISANIAVELPEAPEGGTLFRLLFLAALLLFIFTFVANTLAEWVRLRLRERYKVL
jgi:phosphate transport system permease protein